jgi:hypothetical protein
MTPLSLLRLCALVAWLTFLTVLALYPKVQATPNDYIVYRPAQIHT